MALRIFAVLVLFITASFSLENEHISFTDTANWMALMKDKIYNRTLLDIVLPGTHDSGTYHLDPIVGPGNGKYLPELIKLAHLFDRDIYEFINEWSQSQNRTFFEQLSLGIRYLDVRASWQQGWFTEHFLLGVPTQVLLNNISEFMGNHSGEVIVVEIGALYNSTEDNQLELIAMMEKTLGQWMLHRSDVTNGLGSITIGEMVAMNKRIVMLYDGSILARQTDSLWFTNDYTEGEYSDKDKLDDMIAWNTNELNTQGGHGLIFMLSWTLTPAPIDIEIDLLDPHSKIRSLKDMALIADAAFVPFFARNSSVFPGNIVLLDWFEDALNVPFAIAQNLRACYDDPAYIAVTPSGQYCRNYARNGNCTAPDQQKWMSVHCPLSCKFC